MEQDFSNLEIDIASLPRHEEVKLHGLRKKYLLKLHLQTTLSFVFVVLALLGLYFFVSFPESYFYLASVLIVLLFAWSYFVNYQLLRKNGYALREQDIIFRRGFVFEKTTVIPLNRIQHVSVARSFTDKILNLSTLKIFTAGGSGSDIDVPGLSPDTAQQIKEEISGRISSYA